MYNKFFSSTKKHGHVELHVLRSGRVHYDLDLRTLLLMTFNSGDPKDKVTRNVKIIIILNADISD